MNAGGLARLAAALWLMMALCFTGGGHALAHTSFSGSTPADGEVLDKAPELLTLTFSGKLEPAASLHRVTLTGPDGSEFPPLEATLDSNGRTLYAELPAGLAGGKYTVAFRVVAGDGHPLEGSIVFEVNAPEPPPSPTPEPSPTAAPEPSGTSDPPASSGPTATPGPSAAPAPEPAGGAAGDAHAGHHHGAAAPETDAGERGFAVLLFAGRIIYYATLLPLLGWALWSAIRPPAGERMAFWRRAGLRLQTAHLIAFVLHVALQWAELTGGAGTASFLEVLRETGAGQSWLFTGLLSIAGFPLLFRYRFVDGVWALLVIAAKTLRGHASAFEPVLWTRIFDAVHLIAGALWAGGLLAVVLLLRRSPEWFRGFAPAFSAAAFGSFAALAVSGAASVLLFTESPSDLLRTDWGWTLLVKIALVLAVLPVAAVLRRKLKRAREGDTAAFRSWLRADVALLAGIIAVTGVLTHLSPRVDKEMFHWHVMGETAHVTAEIHDLRAGRNELSLKVWVPEGDDPPEIEVTVFVPNEPERAFTLVEQDVQLEDWEKFEGFDRYTYIGEGEISDPEEAVLTVRIRRINESGGELLQYAKKLVPHAH